MSKKPHKPQWEERRREREAAFQILYGMSFSEIPDLAALKNAFNNCPKEDPEETEQQPHGVSGELTQKDVHAAETGLISAGKAWSPYSGEQTVEQDEPKGFTWNLVRGVWDNEKFLDDDIKKYSRNWRIERMGRVELLILRMGLFELLHMGTPGRVVIFEYLGMATNFGLDSAKSFINGILDKAARSLGNNPCE